MTDKGYAYVCGRSNVPGPCEAQPFPVPDGARLAAVESLTAGDFITIWDKYAEVSEVNGPNFAIGDGKTPWYQLRVYFYDSPHGAGAAQPYTTSVGPHRGSDKVVCWS